MSWAYFDAKEDKWIPLDEGTSKCIEEEYQIHLSGKRTSQHVYHCFGDGYKTIIDFVNMETECGSGKCLLEHDTSEGLPSKHATFALRRT